jgi:8-oxo-dGTP pyrophosphatase MutT (NUDIX family)
MKKRYRRGVFVVVYSKGEKGIEYLLLKRRKHWIGWEFTKGGIERGEREIETAEREVKEETGLRVINIRKYNKSGKYLYDEKTCEDRKMDGQSYSLYSAEVVKGEVKIDKKEHSGFKWMSFKETIKILTWENQRQCLKIVNKTLF